MNAPLTQDVVLLNSMKQGLNCALSFKFPAHHPKYTLDLACGLACFCV